MPRSLAVPEPQTVDEPASSDYDGLGLQLSELNPDVAEQFGIENSTGLLVVGVKPGSHASNAGLEDGMVIRKVGNKSVKSIEDFKAATQDVDLKDGMLLLVRNGQVSRFVVIKG